MGQMHCIYIGTLHNFPIDDITVQFFFLKERQSVTDWLSENLLQQLHITHEMNMLVKQL